MQIWATGVPVNLEEVLSFFQGSVGYYGWVLVELHQCSITCPKLAVSSSGPGVLRVLVAALVWHGRPSCSSQLWGQRKSWGPRTHRPVQPQPEGRMLASAWHKLTPNTERLCAAEWEEFPFPADRTEARAHPFRIDPFSAGRCVKGSMVHATFNNKIWFCYSERAVLFLNMYLEIVMFFVAKGCKTVVFRSKKLSETSELLQ